MNPLQLASHAYAIRCKGYTRIEAQVTGAWLDEVRELTDRALAAAMVVRRANGGKLKLVASSEGHEATRCLHCWGDAALRLLDLDIVHSLGAEILGEGYKLWDLSALSVTPDSALRPASDSDFHRDNYQVDTRVARPPYLWCFVCLDDTTPQNGATWVVPGSHHVPSPKFETREQAQAFAAPIAQQICASAGDLLLLDPTALHSAGRNTTDRARRLLNIGLCSAGTRPLLDQWSVAGPTIHPRVSDRVREMMRSDFSGLDETWEALPPNWTTGR